MRMHRNFAVLKRIFYSKGGDEMSIADILIAVSLEQSAVAGLSI